MKGFSWGGAFVLLLGVLIALTPYFIFPVCEALIPTAMGGAVPMKCFWAARVSAGSGGAVAFAGILLLAGRAPGFRMGVSFMVLALGALVILNPHKLIGVCPGETMACHMGTLPALTLLGVLTILAAALILLAARKEAALAARKTAFEKAALERKRQDAAMGKDEGGGR